MTLRARNIPVFLGIVLLAATVALRLGVGGSHAAVSSNTAVSSTLHAFVHESAEIGMTFDDGTDVGSQARTPPTIPPGTYTIRVVDDAVTHNFHLTGPGVDMTTPVDEMQTSTWTVTFQPGSTYRFQCDIHSDYMYAVFQTSGTGSSGGSSGGTSGGSSGGSSSGGTSSGGTSSGGSSSGGSSSGPQTTLRGTLAGTVSAAGRLTLGFGGKPVAKLKAGRYKISVADKSRTKGFAVQAKGHSAITVSGVSFVGTHSVTVNLTAGQWTFYASPGGTKHSFAVS
jgi:plastocyanin